MVENAQGWASFRDPALEQGGGNRDSARLRQRTQDHTRKNIAPPAPSTSIHLATITNDGDEESMNIRKGIRAFTQGDMRLAEACFLEALHAKFDDDIAAAIIQASRLTPPSAAQAACNRIVQLQQKQKAGVNYLVGMAVAGTAVRYLLFRNLRSTTSC